MKNLNIFLALITTFCNAQCMDNSRPITPMTNHSPSEPDTIANKILPATESIYPAHGMVEFRTHQPTATLLMLAKKQTAHDGLRSNRTINLTEQRILTPSINSLLRHHPYILDNNLVIEVFRIVSRFMIERSAALHLNILSPIHQRAITYEKNRIAQAIFQAITPNNSEIFRLWLQHSLQYHELTIHPIEQNN